MPPAATIKSSSHMQAKTISHGPPDPVPLPPAYGTPSARIHSSSCMHAKTISHGPPDPVPLPHACSTQSSSASTFIKGKYECPLQQASNHQAICRPRPFPMGHQTQFRCRLHMAPLSSFDSSSCMHAKTFSHGPPDPVPLPHACSTQASSFIKGKYECPLPKASNHQAVCRPRLFPMGHQTQFRCRLHTAPIIKIHQLPPSNIITYIINILQSSALISTAEEKLIRPRRDINMGRFCGSRTRSRGNRIPIFRFQNPPT